MCPPNRDGEACANTGGGSLSAGLIIAAAASNNNINPAGNRNWRLVRYTVIGFIISLKKAPNEEQARPISASYVRLPPTPPASGEVQGAIDIPFENFSESQQLLETLDAIVKNRDLSALRKLGGVAGVTDSLLEESHFQEEGGSDTQAWKSSSSPIYESNGFFYFLLRAFKSYTVFLVSVSAGLAFAIDIMNQGAKYCWPDGVAILFAISMLVVCPSVSNFYHERKLVKKLLKDKNRLEVKVVRNRMSQLIAIYNVEVGDRVCLKKGDHVPADGLLLDGENLVLDEILNSKIDCVRNPFLFAGSKVMDGHGSMIVTSIGANSASGCEVLKLVSTHGSNEKKLVQSLMDKSYAYLETLSLCASVLIALTMLIHLLIFRKDHSSDNVMPELKGEVSMKLLMQILERVLLKPQGKVSNLASMLVITVIGIQHGIPVVITVSLCCWKEKLELNQVDPRNLSACGSMGLVTIIVLDASGICNEMEVKEFWVGKKDISNNELGNEIDEEVLDALHRGIGLPVLLPEESGSPINNTLISWMKRRWDLNMEISEKNFSISSERLNCSNRVDGVLMRKTRDEEHNLHLHSKGAASIILEMCSHFYDTKGKKHAMSSQKGFFEKVIENMENKGLRPFAFACRQTDSEELKEDELNLLAIVGLKYECQNEIKSEVEAFRKAGVMAKLVSDDELSAVRAIAWELGFIDRVSNNLAIEGQEIRQMIESSRIEMVDQTIVIGNCLPKDKVLMVEHSKKKGHVVAFFGGWTTRDALALESSDIVITEKIRSTEKARELSDISIENFSSLSLILKYGRCAYHNIQKFFLLQFTASISGLIISFVATVHSGDSPLSALHLIWMNLILCLLGGFMMVMELEAQELLAARPAKRTQSLLTKVIWRNIVIQVSYQVSIFLIFEFGGHMLLASNKGEKDVPKTMIFNIFILCQIFNLFNVMALGKKQVLKVVLHSYWFLVSLGIVMAMQILIVEFGKDVAKCVRLNALQWTVCFLLAAFSLGYDWAIKQVLAYFPSYRLAWDLANSYRGFSNRRLFPFVSFRGLPIFSMFLIFSVSYYFRPNIAYSS